MCFYVSMGRSSCLNSSRSDEMKFASFRKQPLPASGDGHLEKKLVFLPSFHILRLPSSSERERERISCFSLGNTSMMTLQTIPGVRGRITSNFGCWIQNELFPPSYLRDVPVLFTARMWTVRAFWGIPQPILSLICAKSRGRCSAV